MSTTNPSLPGTFSLCGTLGLRGMALAFLALPLAEERPVPFAPAAGLQVTKRIEWGTNVTIEEFRMEFGGLILDQGVGLEREVEYTLVVEDTFVAVEAGRPSDLRRSFEEVTRMIHANDPTHDGSIRVAGTGLYTSALQGQRVRFRWDEEAEEYTREWDEDDAGGGSDEWLVGLEEDLDLRVFLPQEAVEEGDTWSVDAEAVAVLLAPGGDLRLHADKEHPEDSDVELSHIEVPSVRIAGHLDEIEGDIRCQLLSFGEEEGLGHALIRIRVEVGAVDDVAAQLAEKDPDAQVFERVERELSILGEGDLRWSLDANHLVSLGFEAEVVQSLDAEWTVDTLGGELPILLEATERGSARYAIELE